MMSARPVMCAIDDSEPSRHAVRVAAWLARTLDARLVLAHAFDPMQIGIRTREEMGGLDITDDDLERGARHFAGRLLDETARTVTGVDVATELAEGEVVAELRRVAIARWAVLLVAGAAARGGLARALIGSVSGALAAEAPCPLVAVPRGAALEAPGAVVAGYDRSAHSLRAARHAAALAARLGRELVLVCVTGDEDTRPDDLARELSRAGVGKDSGGPALGVNVELAVEEGDPVQVLAAVARERAAALVVTGTRGRNPLSAALLGSVSAGLIRAVDRPVALVPASAGEIPAGL
jgi:nucleotide-binding universal stress UspA family protein